MSGPRRIDIQMVCCVANFLRDLGRDILGRHIDDGLQALDVVGEPGLFGDLHVIPRAGRLFDVLGQFGGAAVNLSHKPLVDFVCIAGFQFFELSEPAAGVADFLIGLGNFLINPFRERVIVHDHFHDGEHRSEVAAPDERNDG